MSGLARRADFERPLAPEAMRRMMTAILTEKASPEEVRVFLTTLAERGESPEEIAVAAQTLRAHAVPLPLSRPYELCDTCGTGGDGKGTFNISTMAALVAAAAGARIAKHGNRAASSRCGSADLLEALGVNLAASPAQVARCIEELGFGFCFAPAFHPAMKAVAPIRRELKIRTLFNLIGPLANPAPLTFQLVGVSDARLRWPMATALLQLGIRQGMVVYGRDGLDEVSTTGDTDVLEIRQGRVTEGSLKPSALGVPQATLRDLQGGNVAENAEIAKALLAGERSPIRDCVAANAGCALYVAGLAKTVPEGVVKAFEAIDAGKARVLLDRVRRMTADA